LGGFVVVQGGKRGEKQEGISTTADATMASQSQRSQRERSYPVLSRREVEGLIADGRKILIMDEFVVKADAWLAYHPGGDKAILHMVGRDATDEVNACVDHSLSSALEAIGSWG
jgi:hypothetical protein